VDALENPVRRGAVKPAALLLPALVAAAAIWVFAGAAGFGFSQDDFAALARAAGLLPRFTEPWRWLALQGYFDLMRPLVGLDPLPYHLVSLAGHALATVLVFRMIARFTGPAAALAGAVFFASHAASFTAIYWISTVGDLYALAFALVALEAIDRGRAGALIAPLAFALSLLCKESLLLLPVAVLAWRALDRARGTRRAPLLDPALIAMTAIAVAYAVYFIAQNGLHGPPVPGAEPYAMLGGRPLLENAATYLGWTANPWVLTMRGFTDAIDPPVFGWGLGLAALWLAGAFVPALRERGWLHAGALYAAFILPVLPLEKHTYHYYLYGALAGAGLAVAALIDAASTWMAGGTGSVSPARRAARKPARAPHAAVAPALGALAALVFFLNGHFTARKIETQPFGHPELRAEPIVDRARIATQVRNAVEAAALPPGTTLLFYSPEARAMAPASNPSRETYWERNVRSALYEGIAVRLFQPAVREVRFVTEPAADSAWYALYDITGRTRIVRTAPPGER
jgi:hypothetical protein